MIEPVTTSTALSVAKGLNKPLIDLYEYLKKEAKLNIDKVRFDEANKKLTSKIDNLKKVKTIYKGDEAIDLDIFYYPPKLIVDRLIVNSNDLSGISSKNIVIQGIAGQGKSILLRHLAISEYKKNTKLPIFFELRKINKDGDIIKFIKQNIEDIFSNITDELFNWILKSGRVILFLDGFDELKEGDSINIIKELEVISEKYPRTQIVISSRPDSGIQASNFFKVIDIKPYEREDQINLIRILIEEDDSFKNIIAALEKSSLDIEDLLSTPLMVTMFVMIYRAKLIIPDTVSKFYKDLFSVLIYKHDRTKPGYVREFQSGLDELSLQEWFEYFCFMSKNKNKLSFDTRSEILDSIKSTLNKKFEKEIPTKILNDINKNLCLIIRDGGNYNFVHKTIQEYYTACYIQNRNEDISKKIYSKIHKMSNKFKAELTFLEQIDSYRFNKYLLIPALSNFFNLFDTLNEFKSSIKVVGLNFVDYSGVIENRLILESKCDEGNISIFLDDNFMYREFLQYYVNNDKSIEILKDECIDSIMDIGKFVAFECAINIKNKLNHDEFLDAKNTKYFLKENNYQIGKIYFILKEIYDRALLEVNFEEDSEILEFMENPL